MGNLKKGLLQVYTGDGKGKTTAACGLCMRARGHGLGVCFVQFVKGGAPSGEIAMLEEIGVEVVRLAEQSSGLMTGEPTQADRESAAEAWEVARRAIASGGWDLVVLDEVCVALQHDLLDVGDVVKALRERPEQVEVVCTGRNAQSSLLSAADLVTEMRAVRHPYDEGVHARRGIEY